MMAASNRPLIAILALALLAGCASQASLLPVTDAPDDAVFVERVLVATMRAPDPDPLVRFSGSRAKALSYLDVAVTVPRDRVPGQVAEPAATPDPRRQFAVRAVRPVGDDAAFLAAVNADMALRPAGERVVFVFVHGYNVRFASGVYRHAQIRHDYQLDALPVHFSWPSAGRLPAYLYDRDSVQFARDGLAHTLDLLARSRAEGIFLVAHSMGALLTMEALRQASLAGNRRLLDRIEAVVLASPDIDVDVFRQQLTDIRPRPRPMVIFVSSRDRALRVSQRVRGGHPRVGEGRNIDELRQEGLVVIDVSQVRDSSDRINHSVFASSPSLIRVVRKAELNRVVLRPGGPAQNPILAGIGGASDLAAAIIYLPAQVVGAR